MLMASRFRVFRCAVANPFPQFAGVEHQLRTNFDGTWNQSARMRLVQGVFRVSGNLSRLADIHHFRIAPYLFLHLRQRRQDFVLDKLAKLGSDRLEDKGCYALVHSSKIIRRICPFTPVICYFCPNSQGIISITDAQQQESALRSAVLPEELLLGQEKHLILSH